MQSKELSACFQAGIGVAALRWGIEIVELSIEDQHRLAGSCQLEPFDSWYRALADDEFEDFELIQDYVTVCLSGAAGRYLRDEFRRCPLKKSLGGAGLEMKYLEQLWQAADPESDRAFAISFALLPEFDDGNPEATMYRLWKRAVEFLRTEPARTRLNQLARELLACGRMSGEEIAALLKVRPS